MKTTDFYSSATGTLQVKGGRDENAPAGVSLSIDDLSYIKQGSRANEGSTGTSDYNDLSNKPSINSVELEGNKSLNDLGIQPKIDSSHKVSADNIDDTNTTNKFATASQLAQIETNKNNISAITLSTPAVTGDLNSVTSNEFKLYTNSSDNLPSTDYCFVRTSVYSSTGALQEAFVVSTGVSYVRTKGQGTWHNWLQITNQ